ncbi:hypothetical protein OIU77_018911 [Salix suchowensis]|uniref:Uncharacterized protein n=1 Tax=Salix suchowensis TaxID=1278906 RepID=A0ABQ9CI86_9ROSI|nr:hypothetical protein OIU77_018911 [Salix suchowensis]
MERARLRSIQVIFLARNVEGSNEKRRKMWHNPPSPPQTFQQSVYCLAVFGVSFKFRNCVVNLHAVHVIFARNSILSWSICICILFFSYEDWLYYLQLSVLCMP